jgi:hypothetical protein
VLRLRVSESVATPTSVVLMGINALFGALYRGNVQHALTEEVWSYWWVCVPIVTVGAPFGARFIRERSRLFVAGLLYTCIAAQSVAAFFVVPLSAPLLAFSSGVFLAGLLFFRHQANRGVRRLRWVAGAEASSE